MIREFFLEKFLVLFRQRFFVVLSRRLCRIELYLTPDPACDVRLPREAIQKKAPAVIKSHDFVPEHPRPEGQEHDDGYEYDVLESKGFLHGSRPRRSDRFADEADLRKNYSVCIRHDHILK